MAIAPGVRPFGSAPAKESWPDASLTEQTIPLCIEWGRARLSAGDANRLAPESVVVLEQAGDDAVDIFARGRLIARGQVVVLEGRYCVRVTELLDDQPQA